MKFIDKYDDFWQMEQQGQIFSCSLPERVLCTKYRTLPMIDAVHKGYYEDFAIMLLEANGIEPSRTTASGKIKLKETLKGVIWEINPDLIMKLQNYLKIGHRQKYK